MTKFSRWWLKCGGGGKNGRVSGISNRIESQQIELNSLAHDENLSNYIQIFKEVENGLQISYGVKN